ncbi:MAG: tetratricopeptide repeat protein [Sphingobacteriaceae bacterium]
MNSLYPIFFRKSLLLAILALCFSGCALEKESGFNRSVQNLTAHYNILFNAREIIKKKEDAIILSTVDDYDRLLRVYQDTMPGTLTPDKDLEEAISKANKIIQIKEQSRYLGDAYFLLGRANYLNGHYFNAVEFFDYVYRNYPKQQVLQQEALVWKSRSLLNLNELSKADSVLKNAFKGFDIKKYNPADVYATGLQYAILTNNYLEAEQLALKAISYSKQKPQRLRWTYILAQLQELNRKPNEAYASYTKLTKSNTAYEMAFHAALNRIRIEYGETKNTIIRIDRLRKMIRNDKNKDFIDQIYFEIGDLFLAEKNVEEAVKNYRLSVNQSTINQQQKGLSYLRLADISFKNNADYTGAKKYYDSTLIHLPKNYPGYGLILKKRDNLRVLANFLQEIAKEDTLQMLAKLDETARSEKIDALVNQQTLPEQIVIADSPLPTNVLDDIRTGNTNNSGSSTFYFYNATAVSQGFSDFKQRWGDRKLEDNWRRSKKSSNQVTTAPIASTDPDVTGDPFQELNNNQTVAPSRQDLFQNIPLTPEKLALSNAHIVRAYLEMANFYKDDLEDSEEAILTFEALLKRFPKNENKPAIYYNLYRLYANSDIAKSNQYKNLLTKEYPESAFSKVIMDSDYGQKLNDRTDELNIFYNQVYAYYISKDRAAVITRADKFMRQFPQNKLAPQAAYLRAIALGYQQKLVPFQMELEQIIAKYPDDLLITPLVRQHLDYIKEHQQEIASRKFALLDTDPNYIPFATPQIVEIAKEVAVQQKKEPLLPDTENNPSTGPTAIVVVDKENKKSAETVINEKEQVIASESKANASIFSLQDSTNYYFAVNVSNARTNLASSRFGIGQFNRTNFQESAIKHELKLIGNEHQLIYIGRFSNIDEVKDYARRIAPLMPDIMKVPKDKFNFFIITQENLNKLADEKTLESYQTFYENNY